MSILINHIWEKTSFGDERICILKGLESGTIEEPIMPDMLDKKYEPTVEPTNPSYDRLATMLGQLFVHDMTTHTTVLKDIETSKRAIATFFWNKCSSKLKERILEDNTKLMLLEDPVELKRVIIKYASTHDP